MKEDFDADLSMLDILRENGDMDLFESESAAEFLLLTEGVVKAALPICFIPSVKMCPDVSFFMYAVSLHS